MTNLQHMTAGTDERRIEVTREMPMFWQLQEMRMPIESLTPPPAYNPPTISAGVPPRALGTAERIATEQAAKAHDGTEAPIEAMEAVRVAAKAYEQLRAIERELHFHSTDSGVRIEVYDAEGELIRRIPPNEALAIASGEGTWLA